MDIFENVLCRILSEELSVCMSLGVIVTKSLQVSNLLFSLLFAFNAKMYNFIVVDASVSTTSTTLSSHLVFSGLILCLLSKDFLMSLTEFFLDLFNSCNFSLHPGMSNNISHSKTLTGNELEHASDHVLEFLRETTLLVTTMRSPENISTVSRDELVETVAVSGICEWRVTSDHDK